MMAPVYRPDCHECRALSRARRGDLLRYEMPSPEPTTLCTVHDTADQRAYWEHMRPGALATAPAKPAPGLRTRRERLAERNAIFVELCAVRRDAEARGYRDPALLRRLASLIETDDQLCRGLFVGATAGYPAPRAAAKAAARARRTRRSLECEDGIDEAAIARILAKGR